MPNDWKLKRSEPLADLKLFRARFDYMQNPRNGLTQKMIVLESPDAANIVAITKDQHLLFVKQYRFGISEAILELPGGLVDAGESQEVAAARELREETGYTSEKWQFLGKIPSNPVFMTNWIHHWLATDVECTSALHLDDGEALEVVKMPLAEVRNRFLAGDFMHPHTVNALLLFFAKRNSF